jgi:hypothetical protein
MGPIRRLIAISHQPDRLFNPGRQPNCPLIPGHIYLYIYTPLYILYSIHNKASIKIALVFSWCLTCGGWILLFSALLRGPYSCPKLHLFADLLLGA